jgi:hypothetical protein
MPDCDSKKNKGRKQGKKPCCNDESLFIVIPIEIIEKIVAR